MNCYKLLDVDITSLVDDISMIPRLPKDQKYWSSEADPKLFLKPNIYSKLNRLGELRGFIFEMAPNTEKHSIHIDMVASTKEPAWSGLNLIFEGQGAMKWFQPEKEGMIIEHPSPKYMYKAWFSNYGDPIDIWDCGKVALVRTDIPHQVWNNNDTNRFIASIRWSNRTSWEETLDWFKYNFP